MGILKRKKKIIIEIENDGCGLIRIPSGLRHTRICDILLSAAAQEMVIISKEHNIPIDKMRTIAKFMIDKLTGQEIAAEGEDQNHGK